ncbi:MAG: chemotaxis protein CheW [Planctomycetes bacterium GWF2_41_51]|nr:MAG: chemotaxis protein CheW [Planctomycetes bacterium GWF2_41_51]HBG27267.1 chemotaxis protein CheW [Phycisphaerales bacterium]
MSVLTVQKEQTDKTLRAKEGKYLTFALGNEQYGLEILKVREIVGYIDIINLPKMPDYVKGIINLRGKIIPIVDLRTKFNMETAEVTEKTCIIIVEICQSERRFSTGIIVDHVQEVLNISGENIEDAPQVGSSVQTDFILGMGKVGESVKILLDIDKVLGSSELLNVGQL